MQSDGNPTGSAGLPDWVVADLFDSPTRKRLLCHLQRADGPVALCDVVAELAESSTAETRREVRMALFHRVG